MISIALPVISFARPSSSRITRRQWLCTIARSSPLLLRRTRPVPVNPVTLPRTAKQPTGTAEHEAEVDRKQHVYTSPEELAG